MLIAHVPIVLSIYGVFSILLLSAVLAALRAIQYSCAQCYCKLVSAAVRCSYCRDPTLLLFSGFPLFA